MHTWCQVELKQGWTPQTSLEYMQQEWERLISTCTLILRPAVITSISRWPFTAQPLCGFMQVQVWQCDCPAKMSRGGKSPVSNHLPYLCTCMLGFRKKAADHKGHNLKTCRPRSGARTSSVAPFSTDAVQTHFQKQSYKSIAVCTTAACGS